MGPPGAGKTAVGYELAAQFGFRYTDYEAGLVERYGPVELFVRYRKQAIPALHRHIEESIDASHPPLVLETTAISEREFIEKLTERYRTFTALLEAPLDVALERIGERPRGRNLSNSPGTNQWIWEKFEETHSGREVDLRIDTVAVEPIEAARLIGDAVNSRDWP